MRPTDPIAHPSGWKVATVGQAVEIRRGLSWSKEQESATHTEGTVPVLRIGNVQEHLDLGDLLYISGVKPAATAKKKVEAGWTLMVGSNGNRKRVGNAVLIREDMDFLFASFLLGVRPKGTSGITPEYFYRWLTTAQVQAHLSASAEGTTGLNNLSHSFFRAMSIPFPSDSQEQGAIVRILAKADAGISAARHAVAAAQTMTDSVSSDLLSKGVDDAGRVRDAERYPDEFASTRLGRLPRSWCISSVGAELDIQSGITLNENRRGWFKRHPYLRVANVRRDALDLTDIATVGALDDEIATRTLEVGDLLVVEGHADRMQIGRCALATADVVGMTFQNHLFRLRSIGRLVPEFACLWLNSTFAQRYWNARCGTSSGLNTINQQMLRKLPVPLPSSKEQRTIANIVRAHKLQVDAFRVTQQTLVELKESLKEALISGQLRLVANRER